MINRESWNHRRSRSAFIYLKSPIHSAESFCHYEIVELSLNDQFALLLPMDTLKLSIFQFPVDAPEQLNLIFTLFKIGWLSPQNCWFFQFRPKRWFWQNFKKKFSAICFTPGLKIFLVLSFFHSNKHHFCTCALFESFVVTVTPQWGAQGNWPTVTP